MKINANFVGIGLRPVGYFIICLDSKQLKITTPVFMSAIHKLIRRNKSSFLKTFLIGFFLALSKHERSTGIKAIYKQLQNRLFLSVIEDGIVIYVLPHIALEIINVIIDIFNTNLEDQLILIDRFCCLLHNKYRGRIPSSIIAWIYSKQNVVEKLHDHKYINVKNFNIISSLKLSTKRDKAIFAKIIDGINPRLLWIKTLIPIIEHNEFNLFLYISALLSLDIDVSHNTTNNTHIVSEIPSKQYLLCIGTYDCHSGKGTFNDFLDYGMRVNNMAPSTIKYLGKSTFMYENMYYKISKQVGSDKYS